MKRTLAWTAIIGLLLGVGCRPTGSTHKTPTVIAVSSQGSAAPEPAPPLSLSPQDRLDAAAEVHNANPGRALALLLPWLCPQRTPTKASDLDGCLPGSAATAAGWYLVGKVITRGARHAGDGKHWDLDGEDWKLAAVAFNRAIDGGRGNGADRLYFAAVYELAAVERARHHYAESMRVYLVLVLELDFHVREIDSDFMREVGDMRSLALTEAALMVSDERDWDYDGKVDPVQGLDRPEVVRLMAAFDKDKGEQVDFYAALVETANGTVASRPFARIDCALSRRALDRFHTLAPRDPRFEKLKAVAAACR